MDLLFPGDQPPHTHLGATLLRHVLTSSLRFALHQLGLPLPIRSPFRIEALRVQLSSEPVVDLLGDTPGGPAVVEALLRPGQTGRPELPPSWTGSLAFHRTRLRLVRRRAPRRVQTPPNEIREHHTPELQDALLAELLAALRQRQKRTAAVPLAPCASPAMWQWLHGNGKTPPGLGLSDPFLASWASQPKAPIPSSAPADVRGAAPPRWQRGVFRESYRRFLDAFRDSVLQRATVATDRGLLDHPDDAFFLPMELLHTLDLPSRPAWLAGAVLRNRAEYFSLREKDQALEPWRWSPVAPLP